MKRVVALLLVALVVVGVVRSMDALSSLTQKYEHGDREIGRSGSPSSSQSPDLRVKSSGSSSSKPGRLFVLMVDSLRYATATDPARMPNLVGLRKRSTYAKTISSKDAVTVSALRAAFTGHDGFSVLGFVKNYWRGDARIDSLFRQAERLGVRACIYSDGSFDQFGKDVATLRDHEVGDGTEREQQNQGAEEALADFLSGAHDLVVFHLTYSDHAAHAWGIANHKYEEAFSAVDELIAKIDRAIPASDTFLVMGDHGHDVEGRHALGLDIPTYTSYRGPGFRQGFDLGTISIVEHRYLASWALGLPLDPRYGGARHPAALITGGDAPAAYRVAFDPLERGAEDASTRRDRRERFAALCLYVGLLFAVLFVYVATLLPWEKRPGPVIRGALAPWMHAWAWISPLFLFLPEARISSSLAGAAVSLAWVVLATKPARLSKRLLHVLVPLGGALLLALWGVELAVHRVDIHEPHVVDLETFWEIAAITGSILALCFGAMRVAWGLLAVTAVLFYPTVYRYGSAGTMAIVWCMWLLFLGVEHLAAHARLARQGPLLPRCADAIGNLVPGAVAAVLLLPFFFPSSNNFRFVEWGGEFAIDDSPTWFALALAANLVVFVRVRSGALVILAGLAGVGLVTALETWPAFGAGIRGALLFGALVVIASGISLWARKNDKPMARGLARIATIACLEVASFYFIRVSTEAHQTADALLAALTLTGVFLTKLPHEDARAERQVFALLLGVLVSGWVTLAYTAHRLEWTVLYEWLPAAAVERHVGLLSPILLGRYAIPLLLVRVVLKERFRDADAVTLRALQLSMLKIVCLTAVLIGIGYVSALSNVYIEAVEEAAIFTLLIVGFLPSLGRGTENASSSRNPSRASV